MKKKIILVLVWTLSAAAALLFITSGYPKIIPGEAMLGRFQAWGYPGWFATLIGVIELLGGILILVPRTALYASGALALVMLGAIYTHLSSGIGGPMFATLALLVLLSIAFLRWKEQTAEPAESEG